MKRNQVKRKERKSVQISIRTSKENSDFMKKNDLSPNKIFATALEELKSEK